MSVIAKVKDLQKVMVVKGLVMRDLAKLASVGEVTVFNVCKGKGCSARVSKKICDALDIDFDEIFIIHQKK
jgi:DNA-binding Xre family transcriptional regulator